jgi:hypothetical protein
MSSKQSMDWLYGEVIELIWAIKDDYVNERSLRGLPEDFTLEELLLLRDVLEYTDGDIFSFIHGHEKFGRLQSKIDNLIEDNNDKK